MGRTKKLEALFEDVVRKKNRKSAKQAISEFCRECLGVSLTVEDCTASSDKDHPYYCPLFGYRPRPTRGKGE